MDIEFYRTPLSNIAIVLCAALVINLYHQQKHYSVILIGIGFVLVTFSQIAINYCISIALLADSLSKNPLICNNLTPYIKDIGFLIVAAGIYKFSEHLKNA